MKSSILLAIFVLLCVVNGQSEFGATDHSIGYVRFDLCQTYMDNYSEDDTSTHVVSGLQFHDYNELKHVFEGTIISLDINEPSAIITSSALGFDVTAFVDCKNTITKPYYEGEALLCLIYMKDNDRRMLNALTSWLDSNSDIYKNMVPGHCWNKNKSSCENTNECQWLKNHKWDYNKLNDDYCPNQNTVLNANHIMIMYINPYFQKIGRPLDHAKYVHKFTSPGGSTRDECWELFELFQEVIRDDGLQFQLGGQDAKYNQMARQKGIAHHVRSYCGVASDVGVLQEQANPDIHPCTTFPYPWVEEFECMDPGLWTDSHQSPICRMELWSKRMYDEVQGYPGECRHESSVSTLMINIVFIVLVILMI